ncbi:hypothetical protein NOF55_19090 [Rhizobiaceae bacterium BDR2-2]|uniref:Uncharacterized protein n=1 Tax=Ectorhizobium quercum TaxID=2965071 RepID=A0AAE3N283_9HYPH|nr:hypothetical protein [Ectorhizobium quercum]MCX8999214.1 hypothetical protein [Ectorhizobium quercum]
MAYPIQLIEPVTGRVALGYHGFSWTTLFFGPLPALLRGHVIGFFGMLAIDICTMGLALLIFPFFYNKWHFNWLMRKGYRVGSSGVGGAVSGASSNSQNVINVTVGSLSPQPAAALANGEDTSSPATSS